MWSFVCCNSAARDLDKNDHLALRTVFSCSLVPCWGLISFDFIVCLGLRCGEYWRFYWYFSLIGLRFCWVRYWLLRWCCCFYWFLLARFIICSWLYRSAVSDGGVLLVELGPCFLARCCALFFSKQKLIFSWLLLYSLWILHATICINLFVKMLVFDVTGVVVLRLWDHFLLRPCFFVYRCLVWRIYLVMVPFSMFPCNSVPLGSSVLRANVLRASCLFEYTIVDVSSPNVISFFEGIILPGMRLNSGAFSESLLSLLVVGFPASVGAAVWALSLYCTLSSGS